MTMKIIATLPLLAAAAPDGFLSQSDNVVRQLPTTKRPLHKCSYPQLGPCQPEDVHDPDQCEFGDDVYCQNKWYDPLDTHDVICGKPRPDSKESFCTVNR